MRRGIGVAAGVVGALLTLSACSSSAPATSTTTPPPDEGHAVAVADGADQPSGSALAPGVQVQEGSSLIGTVFPVVDLEAPVDGEAAPLGWEAVLVVDGDPVDVWNRYTSVLGVDEVASARKACTVKRPPTGEDPGSPSAADERFLTEPPLDGETLLICQAITGKVEMEMVVGATGCKDSDGACTPEAEAHLHLRVVDDAADMVQSEVLGTDELRRSRSGPSADGDVHPPELDLTGLATELPAAGEPIDGGLDTHLTNPDGTFPIATLPEGATSLVSPASLIDCGGGLVAVVEFPRTPAGVIELLDGLDGPAGSVDVHHGTDAEGRAWAAAGFDAVGGYGLSVTAVAGEKGRSSVLVTDCGD